MENFLFKMLERAAEQTEKSQMDPKDVVTMDVPLFIRMLELAREDIKTDQELHNVVERVLAIKDRGTLTMNDYNDIVGQQEPNTSSDLAELRRLAGIK